jgi:hypothetical protein
MEQNQKKSEIIGSTGNSSISFSFTRQELDDLKRYLKSMGPGKPERVYLTLKSGYSTKSSKNYSMITVDVPQEDGQSHRPNNAYAPVTDNAPF